MVGDAFLGAGGREAPPEAPPAAPPHFGLTGFVHAHLLRAQTGLDPEKIGEARSLAPRPLLHCLSSCPVSSPAGAASASAGAASRGRNSISFMRSLPCLARMPTKPEEGSS